MTAEQINQLLSLLEKIASKGYTITGASDWPILMVVGALLITAIGMMWADLKYALREGRSEWKRDLEKHVAENEHDNDDIWAAIKNCQSECCPRTKK